MKLSMNELVLKQNSIEAAARSAARVTPVKPEKTAPMSDVVEFSISTFSSKATTDGMPRFQYLHFDFGKPVCEGVEAVIGAKQVHLAFDQELWTLDLMVKEIGEKRPIGPGVLHIKDRFLRSTFRISPGLPYPISKCSYTMDMITFKENDEGDKGIVVHMEKEKFIIADARDEYYDAENETIVNPLADNGRSVVFIFSEYLDTRGRLERGEELPD